MRLLIIGPEKRKETETAIIGAAKKYFEKVFYVSVESVRIEAGGSGIAPFFEGRNLLDFDVVLVRIPKEYRDFSYVLARIFEENGKYLPAGFNAAHLSSSEILLPIHLGLKNSALKIPATYFVSSRDAVKQNLGNLSYPVTIRSPYEKNGVVKVDSKESALGIIDTMDKLNQPVLIQQDTNGADVADILVAWDKVYALRNKKPFELSEKDKQAVAGASKAFGAQICRMDAVFFGQTLLVRGISPAPKLMIFAKNFGGKIIEEMLSEMRRRADDFFKFPRN